MNTFSRDAPVKEEDIIKYPHYQNVYLAHTLKVFVYFVYFIHKKEIYTYTRNTLFFFRGVQCYFKIALLASKKKVY